MDNLTIARTLSDHARRLAREGENLFRVRAYRRAAETVLGLDRPVADLLAEDLGALTALPGIGTHLAFTIEHLVCTGEFLTFEERDAAAGRRTRRRTVARVS
jgi:DNA polymerase (family 10)